VKTLSQEMLDQVTHELVEALHPEQIVLFGSHAWGSPHQDSDLDLFIVMSGETEITMELKVKVHAALSEMGFPKDIVLSNHSNVQRMESAKASLTHEVLNKGKVIYGSSNS
jgi:uncharacterized protein